MAGCACSSATALDTVGVYWYRSIIQGRPHPTFMGVRKGDGSGGFGERDVTELGTGSMPDKVLDFVDLTGDGDQDPLLAAQDAFRLVDNDGSGDFTERDVRATPGELLGNCYQCLVDADCPGGTCGPGFCDE